MIFLQYKNQIFLYPMLFFTLIICVIATAENITRATRSRVGKQVKLFFSTESNLHISDGTTVCCDFMAMHSYFVDVQFKEYADNFESLKALRCNVFGTYVVPESHAFIKDGLNDGRTLHICVSCNQIMKNYNKIKEAYSEPSIIRQSRENNIFFFDNGASPDKSPMHFYVGMCANRSASGFWSWFRSCPYDVPVFKINVDGDPLFFTPFRTRRPGLEDSDGPYGEYLLARLEQVKPLLSCVTTFSDDICTYRTILDYTDVYWRRQEFVSLTNFDDIDLTMFWLPLEYVFVLDMTGSLVNMYRFMCCDLFENDPFSLETQNKRLEKAKSYVRSQTWHIGFRQSMINKKIEANARLLETSAKERRKDKYTSGDFGRNGPDKRCILQ